MANLKPNHWLIRLFTLFASPHGSGKDATEKTESPDIGTRPSEPAQVTDGNSRRIDPALLDTDRVATRLKDCATILEQTCRGVEADFLKIGGHLQSIHTQATDINKNAKEAVDYIGLDTENSPYTAINIRAYRALDDFKTEQARVAERMQNVHLICDYLYQLHNKTGGLGRIAKDLKMVAININIESSRALESHDSFSALSEEIRALSNAVASLAQTLYTEIRTITQKLEYMQQAMEDNLNRFTQLADEARCMADKAGSECQTLMDSILNILQRVRTNSEAISRSTGQIVVSLQIHDSVSQRVEHITAALDDARRLLSNVSMNDQNDDDFCKSITAVDSNLDIQQSQLEKIIDDIEQVLQNSTRAFQAIGETVSDVTANIQQIVRGEESDHSKIEGGTGSIESLKTATEKIQELIRQGSDVFGELKAIGRDATTAVGRIGDYMEQIRTVNFDIHLKSLNATFKSIHLGDRGRAIGVLVQEIKELATQSNELVEQTESVNSMIMKQADELQDFLQSASADGENTAAAASSSELDKSIQGITKSGKMYAEHSDVMSGLSRDLGNMIAAARDRLAFLKPFADRLRRQQNQLIECRAQIEPWIIADDKVTMLDEARLTERYTMAQERHIHKTVLDTPSDNHNGICADPAGPATVADHQKTQEPGAGTGEIEFDDNIELF